MKAKVLAEQLTAHGLCPTAQRIAVYEYLLTHPKHPTADEIYAAVKRQYPSLSRMTVYNVLRALGDAGLCRTVQIHAEEQRFDGTTADHAHARCRVCGKIWDMPLPPVEVTVPQGFTVEQEDVLFTGVCETCTKFTENTQGNL